MAYAETNITEDTLPIEQMKRVSPFEAGLSKDAREGIRREVRQGAKDLAAARHEEYDDDELKGLARELISASVKKLLRPPKAR